jgi:hypothetical protein
MALLELVAGRGGSASTIGSEGLGLDLYLPQLGGVLQERDGVTSAAWGMAPTIGGAARAYGNRGCCIVGRELLCVWGGLGVAPLSIAD